MAIFEQRKPDSQKGFFANYEDHLNLMQRNLAAVYNRFWSTKSYNSKCNLFFSEVCDRIEPFQPLRDQYDYTDELMGATIIPLFSALNSLVFLIPTLLESAQALAIQTGLTQDDNQAHAQNAVDYLLLGVGSLAFAAISFAKSLLSLITRPFATLITGFQQDDKYRFYNRNADNEEEESLVNDVATPSKVLLGL